MDITLGSRYFTYNEGKLKVIKVLALKEDQVVYKIIRNDSKDISYGEYSMSDKILKDEFTLLEPDGRLMFNIVTVGEEYKVEDIVISLLRSKDMIKANITPFCACRQNIRNIFYDTAKPYDNLYEVGLSMSQETVPEGIDFNMILACNSVISSFMLFTYMTDNINDILECLPDNIEKEMNKVLYNLKQQTIKSLSEEERKIALDTRYWHGYCNTVRDLLIHTEFMYDYERCFYINNFKNLNIEKMGYTADKDIYFLDNNGVDILRKAFPFRIDSPYFIRYDKDIDIRHIRRNKIFIKDITEQVWLCIYDSDENNGLVYTSPANIYIPELYNIKDYYG